MRYLKHTKNFGIIFRRKTGEERDIFACVDSSFACENGSRSRFGYFFFFSGALVSWTSSLSTRILTSSTEAECHGLVQAGKENTWMREFLKEMLGLNDRIPTMIFHDNKSAISLSKGGTNHKRSGHFELEFNKFREYLLVNEIEIQYL